MRALLVDDDHELARLLDDYLGSHGVALAHAENGVLALEHLGREVVDVILLDLMLPGADGFEVYREIRKTHDVPVLMLTARGDDTDRIVGLELGADDYVAKPFNPRELLARMRAVVRRVRPAAPPDRIQVGRIEIDVPAHAVFVAAKEVTLTSFEFRVLVALARRAGETVPREELALAVARPTKGAEAAGAAGAKGSYDPTVDRSLDVHVSHLRQKIGDDARDPKMIRTVRGLGYVLVKPA